MKIEAFWNMTICRLAYSNRSFEAGDSNNHYAENDRLLIVQYVTWSSRLNVALNCVKSNVTNIHASSAPGRWWPFVRNFRH
jgi:hypothetical protein